MIGLLTLTFQLIGALKEQTKYPVLVAVDEINALQNVSLYRDLDMKPLPCKNVRLAQVFGAFTDAGYKRGVVVGAAVRQGVFAHVRLPLPKGTQPIRVRGFTSDEIRTYLEYMHNVRDFFTPVTNELIDYLTFCTAGRPLDIEKACAHEIFNIGLGNHSQKIQRTQFYKEGGFHDEMITDPALGDVP